MKPSSVVAPFHPASSRPRKRRPGTRRSIRCDPSRLAVAPWRRDIEPTCDKLRNVTVPTPTNGWYTGLTELVLPVIPRIYDRRLRLSIWGAIGSHDAGADRPDARSPRLPRGGTTRPPRRSAWAHGHREDGCRYSARERSRGALRRQRQQARNRSGLTPRELHNREGIACSTRFEAEHFLGALRSSIPGVVSAAASVVENSSCREALRNPEIYAIWLRVEPSTLAARFHREAHRPIYSDDLQGFSRTNWRLEPRSSRKSVTR